MPRGTVIRAHNSFYYVQNEELDAVAMCTLRGRLKKERFSLGVGDVVEYTMTQAGKGVVEKIMPRRSLLLRPVVANVDQVVVTFAAVSPDFSPTLLDRFLVLGELSGLDVVICINKIDLAEPAALRRIAKPYEAAGYSVLPLAAKQGRGVEALRRKLAGKISVFAGPSGVGKSTVLNAVDGDLRLATGEVSRKIGRGRHTTRFAQLLPLAGGGFVVDTPGFSSTEFQGASESALARCFPEFAPFVAACRFSTCLHLQEPQCAVKQAVEEGKIARSRYETYQTIQQEIKAAKKGF